MCWAPSFRCNQLSGTEYIITDQEKHALAQPALIIMLHIRRKRFYVYAYHMHDACHHSKFFCFNTEIFNETWFIRSLSKRGFTNKNIINKLIKKTLQGSSNRVYFKQSHHTTSDELSHTHNHLHMHSDNFSFDTKTQHKNDMKI